MEKQRIAKRAVLQRRGSSSRYNNKSAVFNTDFMSHFDQKTSRKTYKTKKSSGFSFPIPSLATVAVAAGIIFVVLLALKWENFNIKLPENYAFQIEAEETVPQTTQYASTGIPLMMIDAVTAVTDNKPDTAQTDTVPTGTATVATDNKPDTDELITFQWRQYKVQKGDSVSTIAKKFGVSIGAVISSNNISNARRLQEGVSLKIPNIDGIPYSIKAGDSLSRISASFNVPLDVILDVNDLKSDIIKAGQTIFIPGARMNDLDLKMSLGEMFVYPVQSKHLTSGFGMRKDPISGELTFHTGIDLRANTGATVMASMEGTVSVISENWLYGKHIIMSHPNGYKTMYAHLNSVSVKQGDKVAQGRKIAEAGNTGYSTGAHLHFTIYDKNGKLINPLDLLN
jgi:murein DD-endopeptidase MepM/ murein hydrolase activator NlpD